ncbi:hypothetical protein BN946_scf184938.g41 [Trametes cinnabarina]|uniref:Uncharacterized protein n=1 Tax=Pycnoporus cinnabarinus TaxID=5643 RepID=A0A060S7C5_PYCCI|nr:hypothetical protein BN946_scf184938.g41 [Trametes cinnabarina]
MNQRIETRIDFVPGVKQNPPSNHVPHCDNVLHTPSHSFRSQNPTSIVAARHCVCGAKMHAALPLYTVQSPPHTDPFRFVQYVSTVRWAERDVRACDMEASPMKVRWASVVASQLAISLSLTMNPAGCETRVGA